MGAVFRSLILALLASLSMWAYAAGPCESDVTAEYVSIQGTSFKDHTGSVNFFDRQGHQADFRFGIVMPNSEGTVLEKWAAELQAQGTVFGILRTSDLKKGIRPKFTGGFLPDRNILLMLEEPEGINVATFKHEKRHAGFDQLLRKGQCTVFAAHGYQTFEELYTHAWHVLEVPASRREYVMGYFLDEVMHVYEALPAEELGSFSRVLGKIKSGEIQMQGVPEATTHLPLNSTISRMGAFEHIAIGGTRSPFRLTVHNIEMHGQSFLALSVVQEGLMPVTLYFANPDGVFAYSDLKLETGIVGFAGPRGQKLLDLAIRRLNVLATLTNSALETFATIRNEIANGRTGDEAAKHLVELLEPYRTKIEKPFSVEPETK